MAALAGAIRMADALLRGVGDQCVTVRMPAAATAGDSTEQVGLATPQFQDYVLAPVTFRRIRAEVTWAKATGSHRDGDKATRYELLVSASAVQTLLGSLAYESVSVLFQQAFGVLVGETLLQVDSCTAVELAGGAAMYRLLVRAPLRLVV